MEVEEPTEVEPDFKTYLGCMPPCSRIFLLLAKKREEGKHFVAFSSGGDRTRTPLRKRFLYCSLSAFPWRALFFIGGSFIHHSFLFRFDES